MGGHAPAMPFKGDAFVAKRLASGGAGSTDGNAMAATFLLADAPPKPAPMTTAGFHRSAGTYLESWTMSPAQP